MATYDLEEMLGLSPKKVETWYDPIRGDIPVTETPGGFPGNVPYSPTVLETDEWDRAQGERIFNRMRYKTDSEGKEEYANSPHDDAPGNSPATDFFAAAFKPEPVLAEKYGGPDKLLSPFMKTLLETPDYKALHESTCLNTMTSEMAATEFGKAFQKTIVDVNKKNETVKGKTRSADQKQQDREMAVIRGVGKGLAAAQKEVEEYEEACRGLGGMGGTDGKMDVEKVTKMFAAIKENPQIRRIMQLAGRYRRVAQSKQRQKAKHGYDDVVGVELGGDVGKLVPQELAMLATPELELDAMRRLVEKQSLQREHRGVEKVGKGPIVVCVDESGSMSGEPVAQAKAFALAMAWIAKHQGRWIALVGYSGGTEGALAWFPPGKWDTQKLLDWLGHFYGGGTTIDVPLSELPTTYWGKMQPPKGKTDLILITDGIVNVPAEMERKFLAWKKDNQVRCISLILNGQAGDLKRVSDEVHMVSSFGLNESGIEQSLGI